MLSWLVEFRVRGIDFSMGVDCEAACRQYGKARRIWLRLVEIEEAFRTFKGDLSIR